MARLSNNNSANYLTLAAAPVTAYPLTLACWYKPTAGTSGTLIQVGTAGTTNQRWVLAVGSTLVAIFNAVTTSAASATTTNTGTVGAWMHAAAVGISATSRFAYIDGGGKTANTTSRALSGMNQTRIGDTATNVDPADGAIAEAGIWNVALTDDEIAALARGVSPLGIRRASLVGYWPLWGIDSPEPDYSGLARNMTIVGTLAYADHAPIALRAPVTAVFEAEAGVAAASLISARIPPAQMSMLVR